MSVPVGSSAYCPRTAGPSAMICKPLFDQTHRANGSIRRFIQQKFSSHFPHERRFQSAHGGFGTSMPFAAHASGDSERLWRVHCSMGRSERARIRIRRPCPPDFLLTANWASPGIHLSLGYSALVGSGPRRSYQREHPQLHGACSSDSLAPTDSSNGKASASSCASSRSHRPSACRLLSTTCTASPTRTSG